MWSQLLDDKLYDGKRMPTQEMLERIYARVARSSGRTARLVQLLADHDRGQLDIDKLIVGFRKVLAEEVVNVAVTVGTEGGDQQ